MALNQSPILLLLVAAGLLALHGHGSVAADSYQASQAPHTGKEDGYRLLWVRTILGPCCTDEGRDLVVDADGGVLIAGRRGGLDLDRDGKIDIQTFGSPDPLILKTYDDNVRGWVQGPGGPQPDEATGITPDGRGGAYAVGYFADRMRIAGATILSAGRKDGFVSRYAEDGTALWAKAIGGLADDELRGVASDSAGNVFVVGTIRGTVDLDRDGTPDVEAVGASAFLLATFDPDGILRWARVSGGNAVVVGQAIAVGPGGEIYVGGHYSHGAPDLNGDGTPDLPDAARADPAAAVTPETDLHGFYARFDPSGRMVWAKAVTGPAVQTVGSLAVADNSDLLVLGAFTGSADLGDGGHQLEFKSLGDRRAQSYADGNSFLLRVAMSGRLLWGRRYAAMAAHVATHGHRIAVSGSYTGPLDLDDDGRLEREADPDPQIEGFAAILDRDGLIEHVFTIVGQDGDVANAAGFSPDGRTLYVTGYTKLGADFDGDDVIESASACHQLGDLFLVAYAIPERNDPREGRVARPASS